MPEIKKAIIMQDGTVTNLVDPISKQSVNYKPVTTWYDGQPMTNAMADGRLYRRQGTKFYRQVIDKDGELFLEKDTMAQMRALTSYEILLLKAGVYKGVKLNGYYTKNDTPKPIEYVISSTSETDDGGSVIVIGDVKLEHKFTGDVDVRYFGAKSGEVINNIFDNAQKNTNSLIIDDYYTQNAPLVISKSNFSLSITNKGYLHSNITQNGNGITVGDDLTNISINGSGTIKGSTNNDTVGYSIAIGRNTKDVKILGTTLEGFTGGILLTHNNRNVKINSNSFYDMKFVPRVSAGGYGIVFQESYDTITIGNYFDETVERHHIYYALHSVYSTIESSGEDHILSSNVFKMKSLATYATGMEYSVKIMATKNVTCTGNTLQGGAGGFWVTSFFPNEGATPESMIVHCKNINIIGNTITGIRKGNSGYASAIGSHGTFTKVYNLNVSENIIQDCESSRGDIDLARVYNADITNNRVYGNGTTNFGIYVDITAQDLTIHNNRIYNHNRGIYLLKNSAEIEDKMSGLQITENRIKSNQFGIFQNNENFEDDLEISNNTIKATTTPIYINRKTPGLVIKNNKLTSDNGTSINIVAAHDVDSFIYGNIYPKNRNVAIANAGIGLILQPLGDKNVQTTLSALPATTSRVWVAGDIIWNSIHNQSGWIRQTYGTGNVLGTDWAYIEQLASETIKGVVNRSAFSADTATVASGANPTKTEFDALLAEVRDLKTKMRTAGQAASS